MSLRKVRQNRRAFVKEAVLGSGALLLGPRLIEEIAAGREAAISLAELPIGSAPRPIKSPHFPDRLHAYVWRNWALVPARKMAEVINATEADVLQLGLSMGLPKPPHITLDQQRRSYITVIRRNWHLLPYEQLLILLGWSTEKMAFALREDDFLFVKLGGLKPACEPLYFSQPSDACQSRAAAIASILREEFPLSAESAREPLFAFVSELSSKLAETTVHPGTSRLSPRFCYSYFALYGDPLLDSESDPYPDGYLARIAQSGVDGVWLQAVLSKLAPFPWDRQISARHGERQANLLKLVARARRYGIGVYLYLNEPRAMPLTFFESRPGLKGVTEGGFASLCTSLPDVQKYLADSIESICRTAPNLAGFFTITASENLTNCWSHSTGQNCPRCGQHPPADVIAGVNQSIARGIQKAGTRSRLIAWDWGWNDAWAADVIRQLPQEVSLMSVSEWRLPLDRGGIKTEVGEYSISAIGPGPRATSHWRLARERGLKTLAKIQAGNTWELSSVPYIPAVKNVARHVANLRDARINGLMLGWTLGGYPSPNLEVAAEIAASDVISPEEAMQRVAERRFGKAASLVVVQAWEQFSLAFKEFPYHGGLVYSAPLQVGPANPLWSQATGYTSTMVGFPYDHLEGWRAIYPTDVYIAQFEKVASGFESGIAELRRATLALRLSKQHKGALARELGVAEAAAMHFRSVANQARFVRDRNALAKTNDPTHSQPLIHALEQTIRNELELAKRLHAIQSQDSRIGFEASNQYFYVPEDLIEKVVNCRDLLDRWLPEVRNR